MTTHTEFSTAVFWSLDGCENQPCAELQAICRLLDAPELTRSPAQLYPSNEPIIRVSKGDSACFLKLDIAEDPTDPMQVAGVRIRCANDVADSVEQLLRRIRSRSEVATAFLRGNLGLSDFSVDS